MLNLDLEKAYDQVVVPIQDTEEEGGPLDLHHLSEDAVHGCEQQGIGKWIPNSPDRGEVKHPAWMPILPDHVYLCDGTSSTDAQAEPQNWRNRDP